MTALGIISGVLLWFLVLRPLLRVYQDDKTVDKIAEKWSEAIKESLEETELMNKNEIPTDEHIQLYYKMYLKKDEIRKQGTWTTEEPLSFEDWEKKAKGNREYDRYKFMIPMTCDAMIGLPPNVSFQRFTDYKRMVQNENN